MVKHASVKEMSAKGKTLRARCGIMFRSIRWLFIVALLAGHAHAQFEWPPEPMRGLPSDYLERLRACMAAGTERLGRMKLADSKSTDSIGWVRYGQPSLLLGRRVEDINAFFESDKLEWNANPKFGFSLFTVSFMRFYGITNTRTGMCKGLL